MRIRQKSILLLLLCAMIPLLAISIISFVSAEKALEEQAAIDLQVDTDTTLGRIETFFETVAVNVAAWSTLPVIQDVLIDDDDGEIAGALARLRNQHTYISEFLVINDHGLGVSVTDERNLRRDFSGAAFMRTAQQSGMFQGRVEVSDITDSEGVVFAVPIRANYNPDTIIGTFVGVVDWTQIKQTLSEVSVTGKEQSGDHILILKSAEDSRVLYRSAGAELSRMDDAGQDFLTRTAVSSGVNLFSDPHWVMQSAVATDVLYAQINTLRFQSLIVGTVVLVVVLGVGFWGANHLSNPIVSITQVMEKLAGGQIDVEIAALDRTDEIGEMARALLVFKDNAIKRKEAEEDLREAKDEAVQANIAKSRFLAAASHDLRQPLHAQGLFVASLFELTHDQESRRILGKIEQSVEAVDDMLSALLDITSLDTGALTPDRVHFRIDTLLESIETDFSPEAAEKGIDLRVMPCSAIAHSDLALLSRIVRNLVSNALRYTESGRVLLGCRHHPGALRIEVWDTGIGIPETLLGRIFEEFYRTEDIDSAGKKRLGLGLAIVERTARLLGHRIRITSTPGRGSMFSVEVPYGTAPSRRQQVSSAARNLPGNLAGRAVLVIDDDEQVLSAMRSVLGNWGCQVVVARSGEEAVAAIGELGRAPDLAVVDYLLGEEQTAVDALGCIEAELGSGVPTVIVTGTTSNDVMLEFEKNGYQVLHKPVKPAKLRATFNHMLDKMNERRMEEKRAAGDRVAIRSG